MWTTYNDRIWSSVKSRNWWTPSVLRHIVILVCGAGGEGMAGARRRAGVQPQGAGQDVHVRRRLRLHRRHTDHVR